MELEDHPLGMLVVSCTRFAPSSAMTCNRLCAARLDSKRRSSVELIDEQITQVGDDTLVSIPI